MKIDYNKMAKEVHEENKAKGFYDKEPDKDMSLLLIVSELIEMVEADRKGRELSLLGKRIATNLCNGSVGDKPSIYKHVFENTIKDTIEDEAADVIIRILDYAGWKEIDIDVKRYDIIYDMKLPKIKIKATDIWNLIDLIKISLEDEKEIPNILSDLIIYFAGSLKIDIWKHVELKRKYNKLRQIRNGKKY